MLVKILLITSVFSIVALVALLFLTNPTSVGPAGVLLLFVLAYIATLGVLTIVLRAVGAVFAALLTRLTPHKTYLPLSLKKSYYFSTVLALVPILTIGIQSVGQVRVYEFGLILIFALIGCIYVARQTA